MTTSMHSMLNAHAIQSRLALALEFLNHQELFSY